MVRSVRVLALGLLALVTGCGDSTGPDGGPPKLRDKIVFASTREGFMRLYVMDTNGTSATVLPLLVSGTASMPAVSPDGTKIAFWHNNDVWVMDADGANQVNLSNAFGSDGSPSWSPDGSRIAFHSDRSGTFDIWIMDADGANPVNVTSNPARDTYPRWAPDGQRIAFTTDRDGNREVYVMAPDGTGLVNLTQDPASDGSADWSQDGSRLAFVSTRGPGGNELFVMDASGANVTAVPMHGLNGFSPDWSPDDLRLAFSDGVDLYVVNIDGSGLQNLTNQPMTVDADPAWSP